MATLDIFILVILAIGLLRGWKTGFLKQVASLGGTILAFILSASFMDSGAKLAELNLGSSPETSSLIAFVAIFLVVKVAVNIVMKAAESLLDAAKLSGVDRIAGGITGALKAGVALSLVFVVMGFAQLPGKISRDSSEFYTPVYKIVPEAWSFLSDRSPAFEELRQQVEARLEYDANSLPI